MALSSLLFLLPFSFISHPQHELGHYVIRSRSFLIYKTDTSPSPLLYYYYYYCLTPSLQNFYYHYITLPNLLRRDRQNSTLTNQFVKA